MHNLHGQKSHFQVLIFDLNSSRDLAFLYSEWRLAQRNGAWCVTVSIPYFTVFPFSVKISSKFLNFRNAMKNWEKKFIFIDNCVWIVCGKFSLLWQEYLSPPINVLTNSSKISDINERDVFRFSFFKNDEWIK